jgi:DNA polymerase V
VQEGLFDRKDSAHRIALMRTLDRINSRYGRNTLTFAAAGHRPPRKMQRDRLSPCYTTEWEELLRV